MKLDLANARPMAVSIAVSSHDQQTDKAGEPYIEHVARVAAYFHEDSWEHVVAWLHDVVEDDEAMTLDKLREYEFPAVVVDAVDALTKREGEDLGTYLGRVRRNDVARLVKLADAHDNLDPVRQLELPEKMRKRLVKRYVITITHLLDVPWP